MERHRILRQLYQAIGADYFSQKSCVQFSADPAVPKDWFSSILVSEYGGNNSQDLMAITFADASFDWVICNHVLEHVEDDVLALKELVRICTDEGAIQVSFPMPHWLPETKDWGYPRPEDHGHFRYYGADVSKVLLRHSGALGCLAVVGGDQVTGAWESTYILCKSKRILISLCERLMKKAPTFAYYFDER